MPRSRSTRRRRSPDRGVSHRRPTSTLRAWSGSSPRRSSLRSSPRSLRLGATRPCDSGFRVGRAINAHTPSRRPSARQPVLMALQLRLDWRGCVTEPMLLRSDAGVGASPPRPRARPTRFHGRVLGHRDDDSPAGAGPARSRSHPASGPTSERRNPRPTCGPARGSLSHWCTRRKPTPLSESVGAGHAVCRRDGMSGVARRHPTTRSKSAPHTPMNPPASGCTPCPLTSWMVGTPANHVQ